MTPVQYEQALAEHFRTLGYHVERTPLSNDAGVDLFLSRESSKIAVQAKMYGGTQRPVNRAMIFELHGAAEFFDCSAAILATDGRCLPNAEEAAAKLGIELFHFSPGPGMGAERSAESAIASMRGDAPSDVFEQLWRDYVLPLKGKIIEFDRGKVNHIVDVTWAGVTRVSGGPPQTIGIEIFRKAVGELLAKGEVTRNWINAEYPGRGSSIVVRVLACVPQFHLRQNPIGLALVA
jgi:restriction system protein